MYNICTECLDLQKTVYIIFVQNVWIYRNIDCPELHKFNENLCTENVPNVRIFREVEYLELRKLNKIFCTLFLHGMSGFAKKLNIQNSENSMRNCIHYICKEWLDLQKN